MITRIYVQYRIRQAGADGVWAGYIREKYGAKMVCRILKSGKYEKVKRENPKHKPDGRQGMVWAVVRCE